jgi:DNA-binding NarL/FixJ family response regulator
MTALRIFLADDDERIRRVIGVLLSFHPGWQVCGEAANGDEAVQKVRSLRPDIVLLDADMPRLNGFQASRQIVQRDPSQKLIILIPETTAQMVRDVFHAGALGFVVKSNATHGLAPAIEAVQHGRTYFTPRFADMILTNCLQNEKASASLSDRDRETLRLLAEELASTLRHQWRRPPMTRQIVKYLAFTVLAIAAAGIWWYELNGEPEHAPPAIENLLVNLGLKSHTAFVNGGNPDARVWIDLHTGLYYCMGAENYHRTSRGKLAKQRLAQLDHFEPAGGKVCE